MHERQTTPLLCLLGILVVKALLMIAAIFYAGIGLGPDEAQYWTWSQELAWGYYSKPPGIAWQIWLGCQLFGNTELGVRFVSILMASGLSLAVYQLTRSCGLRPWTAFWSGTVMALTPIGFLGSFLATTDGGYLLFWTLACVVITSSLRNGKSPDPRLIGLCILCGALFKWTTFAFWIFFILFWPFYFRQLSIRRVMLGIFIALLGLIPSVIWNSSHEWATFRHVSATVQGGSTAHQAGGNMLEWIGSQAALMSPFLFVLLVMAMVASLRKWNTLAPPLRFCIFLFVSGFVGFICAALFQKMQGNWSLFIYPTGIVILCWYLCEETTWGRLWLKMSVALSAVLFFFVIAMAHTIPIRMNPFKHNLGWLQLQHSLAKAGYHPNEAFLFSDKYQTTSLLSFYSDEQHRAYFLNLQGIRKNQFSYWPGMPQDKMGKTGFFVWVENAPHWQRNKALRAEEYQKLLQGYFTKVELVWDQPILMQGTSEAKGALIFKCIGYNGKEPADSHLY
jgi:4-amino-4-deoxy-L-arabinose transferase-like glycosyltransferase